MADSIIADVKAGAYSHDYAMTKIMQTAESFKQHNPRFDVARYRAYIEDRI